jgi:hypothetical protein
MGHPSRIPETLSDWTLLVLINTNNYCCGGVGGGAP